MFVGSGVHKAVVRPRGPTVLGGSVIPSEDCVKELPRYIMRAVLVHSGSVTSALTERTRDPSDVQAPRRAFSRPAGGRTERRREYGLHEVTHV